MSGSPAHRDEVMKTEEDGVDNESKVSKFLSIPPPHLIFVTTITTAGCVKKISQV